jgi:hypothetical protein
MQNDQTRDSADQPAILDPNQAWQALTCHSDRWVMGMSVGLIMAAFALLLAIYFSS